jgi:iron only hydrogenase large subunit-like protein/ferredoxin
MAKKIKINLNGKEIICKQGQTIMRTAEDNGLELPSLCFHPDLSVRANCRVCAVEVAGRKNLVTACNTKVEEGMVIRTDTARVKRSRNLNIELIFAEHIEKCPTCIWRFNCKLLELAEKYKIEIIRFKDRKSKRKVYKFANAVEIDGSQCIDCRNCLEACNSLQKINFLKLRGKGMGQEVVPITEKGGLSPKGRGAGKTDCIYCGQCALHCPVAAAQEQAHWQLVERVLKDKSKILVAQVAPSIRVSIGEDFGAAGGLPAPAGKIMTGQVVAVLKKLGFNYVFDVNFGADITTIVEAEELIERLRMKDRMRDDKSKKLETGNWKLANDSLVAGLQFPVSNLPMFTSCCPAWIKYVEFFRSDLIANLTTARSPQLHSAGAIKTYWAEKMKIKPKDIVVVSIMPCTAKKFEVSRRELKVDGVWPIDYCLTTRELVWLIKKNKIDFRRLKPLLFDNPLGQASGAAAIYGASGGVMESALRTAEYLLQTAQKVVCRDWKKTEELKAKFCNSSAGRRIEFKDVRGLAGVKTAELALGEKRVRVAVVNGIGNVQPVLDNLPDFDYIEVMACPDGCIGGGGQPVPTTSEIRRKRLAALYRVDRKSRIRRAHENKGAIEVLSWLRSKGKLEQAVLYTKYQRKN